MISYEGHTDVVLEDLYAWSLEKPFGFAGVDSSVALISQNQHALWTLEDGEKDELVFCPLPIERRPG
jgi:hypothetical protein